jgi:hypothetical protein
MDAIPQMVDNSGETETTLVATSEVANSQEQEAEDMRDMRKVLHRYFTSNSLEDDDDDYIDTSETLESYKTSVKGGVSLSQSMKNSFTQWITGMAPLLPFDVALAATVFFAHALKKERATVATPLKFLLPSAQYGSGLK